MTSRIFLRAVLNSVKYLKKLKMKILILIVRFTETELN